MSENGDNKAYYNALLTAQKAAQQAVKTECNEYDGYDYARADDIIAIGKKALNDAGMLVERTSTKIDENRLVIIMDFNIIHAESGTVRSYHKEMFYMPGVDMAKDKAQLTAETVSLSYFYRDQLGIERKDKSADINARVEQSNSPAVIQRIDVMSTSNTGSQSTQGELESSQPIEQSYWQTKFRKADDSGIKLMYNEVPMSLDERDYNETLFELDKKIRNCEPVQLKGSRMHDFINRQVYLGDVGIRYLQDVVTSYKQRINPN